MQLSKQFRLLLLAELILLVFVASCHRNPTKQVKASSFPLAAYPEKVGSYPALTKSGAGYFYDDVLEYRVWIHPKGGNDYYKAFACYEPAVAFSKETSGAEDPLVLVRQLEWINEPEPGKFEVKSEERITEWQVSWLSAQKRNKDSISKFLSEKARSK